ncbi:hypothetical protein [Nesterenkonia flava]|uniref:Phosphodiesterase n=1 Tax=Nesterenkonia flava TaxID=469799 RepID=A0ABU1FTQ6_9MICC|nr:hypothetical protein [Nesterenkonia flava]MDR5711983.1 hypothetical protein [Nesterenkonia flava]
MNAARWIPLPRLIEPTFTLVAQLRSGRAVHRGGEVFQGKLHLDDAGSPTVRALGGPAELPALVRLSKGLGTPGEAPDILGIALRLRPDSDDPIDILTSTVGRRGWRRMLPAASRGWRSQPYSTVLPYRAQGQTVMLGLRPRFYDDAGASPQTAAALAGNAALELLLEERRGGAWHAVGRLHVGAVVERDLAFDPYLVNLPDLAPVPFLAATRRHAYRGSRRGRGAALGMARRPRAARR